jgi:hypothetical protein
MLQMLSVQGGRKEAPGTAFPAGTKGCVAAWRSGAGAGNRDASAGTEHPNGSFALERDRPSESALHGPRLRRGVVTEIGEVVDRLAEPYLPPRRASR